VNSKTQMSGEPPVASIRQLISMMAAQWPDSLEQSHALLTQIDATEDIWDRRNWRGHITATAVVLDRKHKNVLFVEHVKLGRYLLPGGHCDPFEMPIVAAKRELAEETGLASVVPHPWHVANRLCPIDLDPHRIPANNLKREHEHVHHDFRYIFVLTGEGRSLKIRESEVASYGWRELSELNRDYGRVLVRLGGIL
jgi:8-oxo-dGTP pyrophosphatase MutT (NUDIX family)